MECKHKKIQKLLLENNREDLLKVLMPLVNNVKQSYIINEIKEFISDNNPLLNTLKEKEKIDLVVLMRKYYDCASLTFLTDDKILKRIKQCKRDIYKIKTACGIRVATKREVEEGALGLIKETDYILGEEKKRLLNLLGWTITGYLSYYREAGYKYNYTDKNGLEDTIYQMISRVGTDMQKMLAWVSSEEFDNDIYKIDVIAKRKYVYPEYAQDEVISTPSIKQIVYYIKCNAPKGSKDEEIRKALYLALKEEKRRSPEEESYLRQVYTDIKSGRLQKIEIEEENVQLREQCDTLINARNNGLLSSGAFVFRIVDYIVKSGYRKCSEKQYNIIQEALKRIGTKNEDTEKSTEGENSLFNINSGLGSILEISDKLGKGILSI